MSIKKIVLVCRSGGDYLPLHANLLYFEVKSYAPNVLIQVITDYSEDRFVRGLHVVKRESMNENWWSKLHMFEPKIADQPFLFMDLDTVLLQDITPLLEISGSTALRDFWNQDVINSSLLAIFPIDAAKIYATIKSLGVHSISEKFRVKGDQAFLNSLLNWQKWQAFYPKQILSYKFDLLKNHAGVPPKEARVICFHGKPRPWDSGEKWAMRSDLVHSLKSMGY